MPKKSESVRESKSNNEHSPMKDRALKPGRGVASYDGENRQKKNREMKPIGGSSTSTGSDDNAFDGIGNLSGGKKSKNGCFPKLFMLLLSIAAGAAYYFLGS